MAENSFFGGIGRALSHPGYRLMWWSNGINTTGRWLFKVSLGWLTWELTGSPAWLGIVAFADTFPMVIMTIIAGAWADRFGHLRLIRLPRAEIVAHRMEKFLPRLFPGALQERFRWHKYL
ncbi:MAG: MFS transporter [Rhodospirillales bacterium]